MSDFAEFATGSRTSLWRTAWALTGDAQLAEDLVQTALMKVWPRWSKVVAGGDPEAYVRRTMYTTYVSWWRRSSHRESPAANIDSGTTSSVETTAAVRQDLVKALDTLPRRQRAVVVCRFIDDLTEAQTARLLGCSVGTVKSQSARAMARLSAELTPGYLIETRND